MTNMIKNDHRKCNYVHGNYFKNSDNAQEKQSE